MSTPKEVSAYGRLAGRIEELEMELAESNTLLRKAEAELEETRARLAELQAKLGAKEGETLRSGAEVARFRVLEGYASSGDNSGDS